MDFPEIQKIMENQQLTKVRGGVFFLKAPLKKLTTGALKLAPLTLFFLRKDEAFSPA